MNTIDKPIRVLLADDQPMLLESLRIVLEAQPDITVVAIAHDGHEAITALNHHIVDIAVLDIRMPGCDGITAARAMNQRDNAPKILMLTTFDSEDLVSASLAAGAQGFLLKDADPQELADGIRLVFQGQSVLATEVTGHVINSYRKVLSSAMTRVSPESRQGLSMLTPRELEVLNILSGGATNAEIARQLFVGESTVKTHVSNLLHKLGCRDRVALVVLAHSAGLGEASL